MWLLWNPIARGDQFSGKFVSIDACIEQNLTAPISFSALFVHQDYVSDSEQFRVSASITYYFFFMFLFIRASISWMKCGKRPVKAFNRTFWWGGHNYVNLRSADLEIYWSEFDEAKTICRSITRPFSCGLRSQNLSQMQMQITRFSVIFWTAISNLLSKGF